MTFVPWYQVLAYKFQLLKSRNSHTPKNKEKKMRAAHKLQTQVEFEGKKELSRTTVITTERVDTMAL